MSISQRLSQAWGGLQNRITGSGDFQLTIVNPGYTSLSLTPNTPLLIANDAILAADVSHASLQRAVENIRLKGSNDPGLRYSIRGRSNASRLARAAKRMAPGIRTQISRTPS